MTLRTETTILDAYRPSWRWRMWYALTLGQWRHRKQRAALTRLAATEAQAAERETQFRAALPGRMAEITGELNEMLADVLPEGIRFEWGLPEEEERDGRQG